MKRVTERAELSNVMNKRKGEMVSIFPPHMWVFLATVFLMMAAHGLGGFVFGFYYLGLDVNAVLLSTVFSVVVMVVPNILITRGYSSARYGLRVLLGCYCLIGISVFFPWSGRDVPPLFGMIIVTAAVLGMFLVGGQRYKAVAGFYEQRWGEFRNGRELMNSRDIDT